MNPYVDIRLGLRAYLLASPEISAMVGTGPISRVFANNLPQSEKRPSIVYNRVTGHGDHHMQGPSGLSRPRFQIDAWAQTQTDAANLANLVKSRIDGFRGTMTYGTNSPPEHIDVLGVFFADERDGYDSDSELYRMSRDYFVWYRDYNTVIAEGAGSASGGGA